MPGLNYSNSLWDGKTGLWDGNTGLWCGVSGLALVSESLFLNFLTGSLDPRITFSRGSQATLTDSTGKITYAPNNLLTNSESFEASAWTKDRVTVNPNTIVAPDGTMTADKVSDTAAGLTSYRIYQNVTLSAIKYTQTVYAKAAEYSWCYIRIGTSARAWFNIANGTVGTVESGLSGSISDVGNGWYRISCTITTATAGAGFGLVGLTTGNGVEIYTPTTGGMGIYVWGAQLEAVTYQTTPGTYNSTTPKNLLGYTQEFDNAAWTKSNAFVQTNFVTQSNTVTAGTGNTVTNSVALSPDGFMNAFRLAKTDATTPRYAANPTSMTVTASTAYVASRYVKYDGYDTTVSLEYNNTSNWGGVGWIAIFAVAESGVTVSSANSCTATVQDVGGGWYRLTATFTTGATITTPTNPSFLMRITGASGVSVLGFGAQLVQGSTAGDYQPTYAAAAAVQYPAPDNSLTADKLVENTAASTTHYAFQLSTTVIANTRYIQSVYAKAGERNWMWMTEGNNVTAQAYFDLANGVVGTVSGTGSPTATITAIGNGWYRCTLAFTPIANAANTQVRLATGDNGGTYTGDGTSGIYVWGAQLSNSASVDPYVYNPGAAPTSAAYYGSRFDYDPVTLAAKGLLIEEQRTNLLTYSEQFDNAAWTKTAATITANSAVAPDGTTTADTITEDTTPVSAHRVFTTIAASAAAYTASIYVKAGTRSWCYIRLTDSGAVQRYAYFNVSTGTLGTVETNLTASITPAGNGWYRCSATVSVAATSLPVIFAITDGNNSQVYTGNGTGSLYFWGAQAEAGAFATSYIPTVASQVTRSADVALMQGANFSNWYNQNAGTISVQGDIIGYTLNQMIVSLTDGTITNPVQVYNDVTGQIQANVWVGGSVFVSYTQNSSYKYALGLENNNVGASINGGAVVSDLSVGPPVAYNRLNIGSRNGLLVLNGHIQRITYYNTRLANTTLQALTA